MLSFRRARRALTTVVACGLVATTAATLSTAAQAAPTRAVFTQPSPIYLGTGGYAVANETDVDILEGDPTASETEIDHAAVVTAVRVKVFFEHSLPSDVELVLVGPQGQKVALLNGAGGTEPVVEADLTFSDTADRVLGETDELTPGDLRPASFGQLSAFPDEPVSTELSTFRGTNAGGTWQLVVNDDATNSEAGVLYEWTLELGLATAAYPSELAVSGVGTVTDVNLTLDDLDARVPADADLLLVGPQGQRAMVMSDAGGDVEADGVDLTIDDQATASLAEPEGPLVSGSYQPSNRGLVDGLPGLGDLVQAPSDLSVFDRTDPNGTWRLYAFGDGAERLVSIGGWSLDLETDDLTAPGGTVSVAGGSAYTRSTAVTLATTATDTGPKPSGARQMRFSNDGTTWSAYQPYAAGASWTLAPGGDGPRSVYAQFRDGSGNVSTVVSDAIRLDTTAPRPLKVKPARHRDGVRPSANVKVITTESLDAGSVTSASVVLKRRGAGKVPATLTVRGRKIILDPRKPLDPGVHRVIVTSGVTDLAGNGFDANRRAGLQSLTWRFTV